MNYQLIRHKTLLLLVGIVTSLISFSQKMDTEYRMLNYTNKDGLPSNETYDIIQDEFGVMWIATDHGLVSYDGIDFTTYGYEDSLTDLTVFKFYPDAKKRIWVATKNNKTFTIDKGKINPYIHNNLITNTSKDYQMYYSVRERKLYFGLYNIFYSIHDNGTKQAPLFYQKRDTLTSFKNDQSNITHSIHDIHLKVIDNKVILLDPGQLGSNTAEILIEYSGKKIMVKNTIKGTPTYARVKDRNQILFITDFSLGIIDITTQQLKEVSFEETPIYVYWDNIAQLIWVGTHDNGVYAINSDGTVVEHLLDDFSVSSIYRDREHNLWFTTLENGVFSSPSPPLKKVIESQSATIRQLSLHKQSYYAFFSDGLFYFQSSNNRYSKKLSAKNAFNYIKTVVDTTTGEILELKYWSKSFDKTKIIDYSEYHFNNIANWKIDISGKYLFRYKEKFPTEGSLILKYKPNCSLVHGGNIYLGDDYGLTLVNVNTLKEVHYSFKEDTRIQCLVKYNNLLVMGTRGRGLKCFDLLKNEFIEIEQHLPNSIINDITIYNNQLWIASGDQLVIATIEGNQLIISSTLHLGIGIIQKTAINDSLVLIANQNEVYELDHHIIEENLTLQPPVLSIVKLTDFEQDFDPNQKEVTLNYQDNNLIIGFQAIHYSSLGNIKNRYRIIGLNDKWQYTNEKEISLLNLTPGSYQVEIASCNWKQQYSLPKVIQIHVLTPYWKTWWFKVIIIVAILLIFYWVFKSENKKRDLKSLSNEYLLASLRSQMNPHFIFNSLNSIRSFIFTNERDMADNYLVKFSKLTRSILQKSSLKYISLNDEIEIITEYLDLEMMRSDNSFTYTIEIDEEVDELTPIPTLIIQPLIENAVIHGVLPLKDRKGLIKIIVKEEDVFLSIAVIDNGVGINIIDSQKNNGIDHKSLGTKLVKDRLRLLNNNSSYSIIPIQNANKKLMGTKVELKIYYH